ncbi:MAG: hypothetical protein WBQ89_20215 [Candidatus Acidiferrum sp.]|jgi:hypothetical protein
MKKTPATQHSYFAEILNAGMQQLDITIRELSKQLRISCEHARRLQAGEVLPSRLLVEKSAKVVGIPLEQLQLAVERDRILKKYGKHPLDKATITTSRIPTAMRSLSSGPPQRIRSSLKVKGYVKVFTGQHTRMAVSTPSRVTT